MNPPLDAMPVGSKAAAILEEVKALPSTDREAFAKLFHAWETAGETKLEAVAETDAPVQWPDFAGRLKKLFPDGPIPGDPQKFWDEMRRE